MTPYILRDYQSECVGRSLDYMVAQMRVKKPRNGLIYIPTGGGKSLIGGALAVELTSTAPVVMLQPGKEILEQNLEKIESYGFKASVMSASMNKREVGDVTLATIGTIYKHPEWFEDFRFGLIDEAHLVGYKDNAHIVTESEGGFYHRDLGFVTPDLEQSGVRKGRVRVIDEDGVGSEIPLPKKSMYKSFAEALPHMIWLGLTASPYRLQTNSSGSQLKIITRTLPRLWNEFVHWTQNRELFEKGYLAKLEYYQIAGFKPSKVTMNSSGSDYSKDALQMHLWEKSWETKAKKAVHFPDKLTEVSNRLLDAGRENLLVFTSSIRESEYLADQMKGECAVITGNTEKDERKNILADFKAGRIKMVTNCAVLIHGFDFPALATVIDAAPTMSLSRYYQKRGRIVRRDPENENKVGWVIDMTGGYQQFGKVEDLTLYCQGQSRWDIFGRPGGKEEKQLTSVWLSGDPGCCPKCRVKKLVVFYPKTGRSLPVSPGLGGKGDFIVKQDGNKRVLEYKGRGQGTHVMHHAYCGVFQKMKEQAA